MYAHLVKIERKIEIYHWFCRIFNEKGIRYWTNIKIKNIESNTSPLLSLPRDCRVVNRHIY